MVGFMVELMVELMPKKWPKKNAKKMQKKCKPKCKKNANKNPGLKSWKFRKTSSFLHFVCIFFCVFFLHFFCISVCIFLHFGLHFFCIFFLQFFWHEFHHEFMHGLNRGFNQVFPPSTILIFRERPSGGWCHRLAFQIPVSFWNWFRKKHLKKMQNKRKTGMQKKCKQNAKTNILRFPVCGWQRVT